MRLPIVFAVALLAMCAPPAFAGWTFAGTTLYSYYVPAGEMDLFPDGVGGVIAGLTLNHQGTNYMHVFRVGADGTAIWGAMYDWGSVAPDGQGGAFEESTFGINDGYHHVLVHHQLPAGGDDPAFTAVGLEIYSSASGRGYPEARFAASDDSGGVYVAVDLGAGAYAWRVLGNGSFTPGWPASGTAIRNAPNEVIDPSMAVTPDGANGLLMGIMATNYAITPPTSSLRVYRRGATGLAIWSQLATTLHTEDGPVLGALRSGDHVFFCWGNDSLDAGSNPVRRNVRLQSVALSSGLVTAGWPAQGLLIATGKPDSIPVKMLDDGAGGVYVVWDTGGMPRAVRIAAAGTLAPGWSAGGNSLLAPSAAFVHGGGAGYCVAASPNELVVGWSDNPAPNIYRARARWLLPDGTPDPAQPDTGRLVGPGVKGLVLGAMSDGNGGAYVGWYDQIWFTTGSNNPYILSWVPYAGDVAVPTAPPLAADGLRVWPNPAHDALRVQLSARDASPARAELTDVAGHRVRTAELKGGTNQSVRFEGLDGLPSGVYFLRVTQGGVGRSTRVALVH